jgi:hypothetical protein
VGGSAGSRAIQNLQIDKSYGSDTKLVRCVLNAIVLLLLAERAEVP